MKKHNLNKRQKDILEELSDNNYIKVNDLCDKLNVSAVTIRKDLKFLESIGKLYRTHGGASRESFYIEERHINIKEKLFVEQKERIAEAAVKFINNNDFITIASGTTLQHLAKCLLSFSKLTVLTSSPNISLELYKYTQIDIIQLGGDIRKTSASVVGPFAENMLREISCNKLFLGVDGIDAEFGITTSNIMEAHLNKVMIESSEKIYILADSSKIGKRGFGKICDVKDIDTLITDKEISSKEIVKFENLGIQVITV